MAKINALMRLSCVSFFFNKVLQNYSAARTIINYALIFQKFVYNLAISNTLSLDCEIYKYITIKC